MPRIAWLFMINSVLVFVLMALLGFRVNISDSYPLGVYKRVQGQYEINSLVESCLPEAVAKLMIEREYIPNVGNCGGYPAVIKKIYATAGDLVEVNKQVTINGQVIPESQLMSVDSNNRALESSTGITVSADHVWLMSNIKPHSYDARYFGETHADLILTNLRPLWTVE